MNSLLSCVFAGALVLLARAPSAAAADGSVRLQFSGNNVLLKVDGDKDDDWWIQASTNLTDWRTLTNLGTQISGNETNAPWRAVDMRSAVPTYYRALQTAGLFDPALFRKISLVYTQGTAAALSNALHLARRYETNAYLPRVWLENGATNHHVGARFRGNSSYAGPRRSINLEFDFITPDDDLMNMETVNLNNAFGDETVMREPLFFNVMREYTPCPRGALCELYANGALWSVFSLIQQEDNQLIQEWFPNASGDRWRAPNAAGGGGGGGMGMFASSNSAFIIFTNRDAWFYTNHYTLKRTTTNLLTALQRLTNAIYTLHVTPTNELRWRLEDVFAVDEWLWFLALENLFVDDDSYWNKGADYGFYYEPGSGRIHPIEHDGNEAFTVTQNINFNLSPVVGASGNNRPLLYRMLPNRELRQRYLAHLRTALDEHFNPATLTPVINRYHALSIAALIADPRRDITLAAYTNDLVALKTYVTNRHNFLRAHAELTPLQPDIVWVSAPVHEVLPTNAATITARVVSSGNSGVGSVWLYFRDQAFGRFAVRQMFDDGLHGDGAANDGVFGAVTTNFPAGNKIHYYIEARATNTAQAVRVSPARAERVTYNYRVGLLTAPSTRVVINEFMADNAATVADPQGDFDDWIELRNLTDTTVDLAGCYLSDNPNNPRKWPFPPGTVIPPDGHLLVWADEDGGDTPGLHANFKLAKSGEQILLVDSDANGNQVLDRIVFGPQQTDISYGRSVADADQWQFMAPTPGAANE